MKKFFLSIFIFIFIISFTSSAVIIDQDQSTKVTVVNTNISAFTELTDTPTTYVGDGGDCVKVAAGETTLEFGSCSAGADTTYFDSIDNFLLNTTMTGMNITNLSVTDKITFGLLESIDNLIDGWITITGKLKVTGLIETDGILVVNGNVIGNGTSNFTLQELNATGAAASLTDTNASTECADDEVLLGNSSCMSSSLIGNLTINIFDQDLNTTSNVTFDNAIFDGGVSISKNLTANYLLGFFDWVNLVNKFSDSINPLYFFANDSGTLFLNETKLNITIDDRIALGGGDNSSWNKTYADTLYAAIIWNYNQSDGSYNVTYDTFAYNQTTEIVNIFDQDLNTTNNVTFGNVSTGTFFGNLNWSWLQNIPSYVKDWSFKFNSSDFDQSFNDSFNLKTTDNLTEGSENLYDDTNWNASIAGETFVNITGDTMTGMLTVPNLTIIDALFQDGYTLRPLETNNFIGDQLFSVTFNRSGENVTIFGVQSGGAGQASFVASSFMLVNRNNSILNITNRTDCQAQADSHGIDLKVDCNTSDITNILGTGPDLLVFGDSQIGGEVWARDPQGEWHFTTRELELGDELRDNSVTSQINVSLTNVNLSIKETDGEAIDVVLNENTTFLGTQDSIILTEGTNTTPVFNAIFYNGGGATPVLTKATTDIDGRADVAQVLMGANYSYASIGGSATGSNFIRSTYRRFYDEGAIYKTGFSIAANTTTLNFTIGVMKVIFDDFDIVTSHSTENITIEIDSTGDFIQHMNDLDGFDSYSDGGAIGNNRYFNLVCGIAATMDQVGRMYCVPQNEPISEWLSSSGAETDSNFVLFFPGNDFIKKLYIPVARIVIQRSGGVNEIQTLSNGELFLDIRGTITGAGSPPTPVITSHIDLTELEFVDSGHTFATANQDMDIGSYNITTSQWFKGLFNWTAISDYLTFDGSTLTLDDAALEGSFNQTGLIDSVNDTLNLVNTTENIEGLGFIQGSHTIDTNASTECSTDEVLLGNTSCYSLSKVGGGNSSFNSTWGDERWIAQANESFLNVNGSDNWDNNSIQNSTQFETNLGTLNIIESWLTSFIDAWLGTKDTDDLSEGTTNFYNNNSMNDSYVAKNFVNLTGDTMEGSLNMSDYYNITIGGGVDAWNGSCRVIKGLTATEFIC